MTRISEAFAAPELESAVQSAVPSPERRRAGSADTVAWWSTLEPWRTVLPTAFLALWIGFSLIPHAHHAFRVPTTIGLAALIAVGAELCARAPGRARVDHMAVGTLWIVPTGATIVIIILLTGIGPRLSVATPLLAGVVVATLVLQALEMSGSRSLASWSRPMNTGAAFALAFAAFVLTPVLAAPVAAFVYAAVAGMVTLVVLRGSRASTWDVTVYVAIAAGLIMQLGLMLYDARSPVVAAGIPVLGLYAVSTTAQAIIDRAPRRAYVEVTFVTFAALAIALFNLSRR